LLSTDQGYGYIEAVILHAQTAIDAPDASDSIRLHAAHARIAAQNALTWAEQLNAKALELAQTQDIETARRLFDEMGPLAGALINGVDANGDGRIDPVEGEGTILTAYEHAQFAASPAYETPLVEGGEPLVVAQATPTPTPPPPTVTPTPEPQVVQVLMQDFVFAPGAITVKAGTTIEFINLDSAPHTATLDDNSKDTGTLNLNDKATLAFDAPGEFLYFCLFHGGPGGVGMAAKIVVEP
jgi:plastocyanin